MNALSIICLVIAIGGLIGLIATKITESYWGEEYPIARRICFYGMIAFIVLTVVFGSFYRVGEQQTAIVTQMGKYVRTDTAGMYFKIPFIQKVKKIDTTVHGTGIGYVVTNDGQTFTVDTEGIMITKDYNLIDIDFYMEYRVSNPLAFIAYDSPEITLKNIALAAIRSTVIDYTVDEAMTTAKSSIQAEVKEKIQTELANKDVGLHLVNIMVQDAEPPTDAIKVAFKAVESAKQGKETAINEAKRYQNEQLPNAQARADAILQEAEANAQARIAEAEGQVARFLEMFAEYKNNPLTTKNRLLYEAIEKAMAKGVKIIITDGNTQSVYPIEQFVNINGNGGIE
jgi:membrane protease subunit HflK